MTDQEFWNDAFRTDPRHTMVPDHVVAHESATLPPGTAVDLGCGTGQNALELAHRGWRVTGVDWSDHAVFLAERAAWRAGVSVRFELGDARAWLSPEPFDLVVSTFALPVGGDAVAMLRNAARLVAPGGTLIVSEWDRSMAAHWGLRPCELHTAEAIATILTGFEVIAADTRRIEPMFDGDDPRARHGDWATISVVRARRPLSP